MAKKLDTFFTQLNAGRFKPYDWAGNEPSLWTPWEYDYFGAPWQTQDVVRKIATTLYHDAPVNEPGNDDLGAISSWYVWAAIGMYPVTPGTSNLALASPLFPQVSIALPSGHELVLNAPQATAGTPYVQSLHITSSTSAYPDAGLSAACLLPTNASPATTVTGSASNWQSPWLPASVLTSGATLDYVLSAEPDKTWGADPEKAPPSYGTGELPGLGFSVPSGGTTISVGGSTKIQLGLQLAQEGQPGATWTATETGGITVSPRSGTLRPTSSPPTSPTEPNCGYPAPAEQELVLTGTSRGSAQVRISLHSDSGVGLPPVVLNITVKS